MKARTRNKWFIVFTSVQTNFGFVVAAIVLIVVRDLSVSALSPEPKSDSYNTGPSNN